MIENFTDNTGTVGRAVFVFVPDQTKLKIEIEP